MSVENRRIHERLEKFKRLMDESRPLFIKKPTKKATEGKKWYHLRTRDIRREIAGSLRKLYVNLLRFTGGYVPEGDVRGQEAQEA